MSLATRAIFGFWNEGFRVSKHCVKFIADVKYNWFGVFLKTDLDKNWSKFHAKQRHRKIGDWTRFKSDWIGKTCREKDATSHQMNFFSIQNIKDFFSIIFNCLQTPSPKPIAKTSTTSAKLHSWYLYINWKTTNTGNFDYFAQTEKFMTIVIPKLTPKASKNSASWGKRKNQVIIKKYKPSDKRPISHRSWNSWCSFYTFFRQFAHHCPRNSC